MPKTYFDEFKQCILSNVASHFYVDAAATALFANERFVRKICSHADNSQKHLYVGNYKSLRRFEQTPCENFQRFNFSMSLQNSILEFYSSVLEAGLNEEKLRGFFDNDKVIFILVTSKFLDNEKKDQIVGCSCSFTSSKKTLLLVIGVLHVFRRRRLATFLLTVMDQIAVAHQCKHVPIFVEDYTKQNDAMYMWLKLLLFCQVKGPIYEIV